MKVCPQCNQAFNDDSLSYCLLDGTALVATESQPTIVMPSSAAPVTTVMSPLQSPKSGSKIWIAALVLLILFVISGFVGLLIFLYVSQGQITNANRPVIVNATPSPKASATPKPTPSPTATASPASSDVKSTPSIDETDEVTPIAWTTSAATFKTDIGKTYKFQCPENGIASAIWGSDIYTADSSICTAAVHAGIINLESGGVVTIEFRPGRSIYGSTVRNGITSNTYGEYPHSFVVR